MTILLIILEIIGFVVPVSAAIVAFRRFYPNMPNPQPGRTTNGDFDRWIQHDIPELFRSRKAALKWPALFAVFGLACSTLAGVLSLLGVG